MNSEGKTGYYELTLTVSARIWTDILVAVLAEAGFESFETEYPVLRAFINEAEYDETAWKAAISPYEDAVAGQPTVQHIPWQNWNAAWESDFKPVAVNDCLYVRAPFHSPLTQAGLTEIIINPQMSFGTGHHPTTFLLLDVLSRLVDFSAKKVLDYGCGTGVLSILAGLKGADEVVAIDIDPNCVSNTLENIALNTMDGIKVFPGNITDIPVEGYDIIIANITRNVIESNLEPVSARLKPQGVLYCSGFYTQDLSRLEAAAKAYGLKLRENFEKDGWCVASFEYAIAS